MFPDWSRTTRSGSFPVRDARGQRPYKGAWSCALPRGAAVCGVVSPTDHDRPETRAAYQCVEGRNIIFDLVLNRAHGVTDPC
jgi:hypothetical protein